MDFYTRLGFNVLIGVLEERKQIKAARRAFLKLFKLIWSNFSEDEEFRAVVQ